MKVEKLNLSMLEFVCLFGNWDTSESNLIMNNN